MSDSLTNFFGACSAAPEIWRALNGKWGGRIALVGHAKNSNREFSLPSDVVALIANRGLAINFDAYFEGPDSDDEVQHVDQSDQQRQDELVPFFTTECAIAIHSRPTLNSQFTGFE